MTMITMTITITMMMLMLMMKVVVMMMVIMTIVMLAPNYRTDDGDDENGDKNLFGAICFPSTQMKKTTSRHPQPRRKTTYANYREGATPVTHHGETGLLTSISQPAISN